MPATRRSNTGPTSTGATQCCMVVNRWQRAITRNCCRNRQPKSSENLSSGSGTRTSLSEYGRNCTTTSWHCVCAGSRPSGCTITGVRTSSPRNVARSVGMDSSATEDRPAGNSIHRSAPRLIGSPEHCRVRPCCRLPGSDRMPDSAAADRRKNTRSLHPAPAPGFVFHPIWALPCHLGIGGQAW